MSSRLLVVAAGLQLAIGLVLIIVPFVVGLPGKASAGNEMMEDFGPAMAPAQVEVTRRFLDNLHQLEADFVPAVTPETVARFQAYLLTLRAMYGDLQSLLPRMAEQSGMSPEQFQAYLSQTAPGLTQGLQSFTTMGQDLGGVVNLMGRDVDFVGGMPTYLAHYDDLVSRMERNVGNFEQVDTLPVQVLPWTLVVPGLVIALAAMVQLGVSWSRKE